MSRYYFNPFAIVTQVDDQIFVNASASIRATFEARHRQIVEFFIGRESFTEAEALQLVARSRLDELLQKRIFLREPITDMAGRYSRQLGYFSITSDCSRSTQERLRGAHVLVLGAGAIGSHACWNLAAMGVGRITVLDFDVVEASNLNRQLMYTPRNIGELKVDVLQTRVSEFNPTIELAALNRRLDSQADVLDVLDHVGRVDVIVKAIDSPEDSMAFVNAVCVERQIPYVTGGFLDYVGVVGPNYIPGHSTCFACHRSAGNVQRLHGTGPTFAPLTTLVAAMVAMVAHKILVGDQASVADKVFSYNTVTASWDTEQATSTRHCDVCGTSPAPAAPAAAGGGTASYRWSMLTLMLVTLLLRQGFEQQFVGVLAFTTLFLSIPVVHRLCDGNATRTRRELFVIACMYIAVGVVATVADNAAAGAITWPGSLEAVFPAIRAVVALIGQAAIGTTVLFLLLCGCLEYAPRLLDFLRSDISEEEEHAS